MANISEPETMDQDSISEESSNRQMKIDNINIKTAFDWELYNRPHDVLLKLKNDRKFIDLILTTNDGGEEHVHLQVVAALGQPFYNLLTKLMESSPEKKAKIDGTEQNKAKIDGTEQNNVKRVVLKGLNRHLLGTIVQYAYTGASEFNEDNINKLFDFATEFEINDLIQLCCDYFKTQISIDSCINYFHLGLKYNHLLSESSRDYILINFEEVSCL